MADTLGERIRQARERYGMSQAELARRIKISKQALYQIESNKTPDPGVLKVKAIADVLKVSVDALLGRTVDYLIGVHAEELASDPAPEVPMTPVPPPQAPAKRQRPRKAAPVD